MKRVIPVLAFASLLIAAPVAAQENPAPTPITPTTPAVPVATTTTTGADTPTADTTAGPTSIQAPDERDVVTVSRKIRPNRPWLLTGGAILIGSYVPTAVITATQGRTVEDRNLFIPVVGPWLNLADRRCDGCANETTNVGLAIGSGVLQGIGAGMAVMSFFIPEKIEAATIVAGPVKLMIAPTQVGRNGAGVGTVGVF